MQYRLWLSSVAHSAGPIYCCCSPTGMALFLNLLASHSAVCDSPHKTKVAAIRLLERPIPFYKNSSCYKGNRPIWGTWQATFHALRPKPYHFPVDDASLHHIHQTSRQRHSRLHHFADTIRLRFRSSVQPKITKPKIIIGLRRLVHPLRILPCGGLKLEISKSLCEPIHLQNNANQPLQKPQAFHSFSRLPTRISDFAFLCFVLTTSWDSFIILPTKVGSSLPLFLRIS